MTVRVHDLEVDAAPDEALAAVAGAAEDWGAAWSPGINGGQLALPVLAGLRRGVLSGRLEARADRDRTRLTLSIETASWRVHRSAAAILVLGAVGALPVILWPLHSDLLALAPVGLVLMFLAWFLVASRLRAAGADDFLESVRDRLGDGSPGIR